MAQPQRQRLLSMLLVGLLTIPATSRGASSPPYRWTMAPAPAPFSRQAYHNASMTTFGGGIVHWAEGHGGGSFHLFATGMTRGCGIHAWSSNAKVIHAVSDTPGGPYVYKDDALAVLAAAPGVARAPDGTFLLFSMGTTNGSLEQDCPGGEPRSRHEQVVWDVRLHAAPTPNGPWRAVGAGPNGSTVLWSAVNPTPSPWVLPNGTVVVIGGGLWVAAHWRGPYRKVRGAPIKAGFNESACSADPRAHRDAASPKAHCASEDPFLMFDARAERWRYLEHQKLDDAVDPRDPREPTGHERQCDFFPFVTGYGVSKTSDRTFLLNVAAPDDMGAHMGPGDTGTFTFIQEVLAMNDDDGDVAEGQKLKES
jgi:hypothetical protein